MFESVNARTDARTDGRWLASHPISSSCEPSTQGEQKKIEQVHMRDDTFCTYHQDMRPMKAQL